MTKKTYLCLHCQAPFEARTVDRKRGWARYCSKSCKAKRQEQMTGQFAALNDSPTFSNANQFDNTEL